MMVEVVWRIIGGTIALLDPAVNTVVFYFHDNVWKNVELKRKQQAEITSESIQLVS